jgi:hypothetical protein
MDGALWTYPFTPVVIYSGASGTHDIFVILSTYLATEPQSTKTDPANRRKKKSQSFENLILVL